MTIHNRTSLVLCVIGGVLLILSGASGAIGVLSQIAEGLQALFGLSLMITFETVMGTLAILTMAGGVIAIIGGFILTTTHVRLARIIIMLAIAVGVAGLLMALVQMVWVGDLVLDMMVQLQQSIGWIGAMSAVVARTIAEQKPMVDRD